VEPFYLLKRNNYSSLEKIEEIFIAMIKFYKRSRIIFLYNFCP
jgi:hypothetical protein